MLLFDQEAVKRVKAWLNVLSCVFLPLIFRRQGQHDKKGTGEVVDNNYKYDLGSGLNLGCWAGGITGEGAE